MISISTWFWWSNLNTTADPDQLWYSKQRGKSRHHTKAIDQRSLDVSQEIKGKCHRDENCFPREIKVQREDGYLIAYFISVRLIIFRAVNPSWCKLTVHLERKCNIWLQVRLDKFHLKQNRAYSSGSFYNIYRTYHKSISSIKPTCNYYQI